MKMRLHNLAPGERDQDLLTAVTLTALFIIAALAGLFLPAWATPPCMFHRLTGIPCFTCGMVRSWRLLLQGELIGAFRLQPLIVVILAGTTIWTAYAWIVSLFHLPRLRLDEISRSTKYAIGLGFLLLILINWAYLIRMRI